MDGDFEKLDKMNLGFSDKLQQLCKACMVSDLSKRPSVSDVTFFWILSFLVVKISHRRVTWFY